MAGRHRSMETGDRAQDSSYTPADPRSSPRLDVTRNSITASTEPRNLSEATAIHYGVYNDEYDDQCEYYTHTSSKNTWQTYSTYDDEIEHGLRTMNIKDGPLRGLGISPEIPNKDIPRSYAEAVKSSPKTTSSQPIYQARSPQLAKQSIHQPARQQGQGLGCKKSTQPPQTVPSNAVRLTNVRQNTGTDSTIVDKQKVREGTNRSPTKAEPTTIRHGYLANRNHTFPKPIGRNHQHADKSANIHASQRSNSLPCEEPTSFQVNTKGIGCWTEEPSSWDEDPSPCTDIPRVFSSTSLEYLDAVLQCGRSGNSDSGWPQQQFASASKSGAGRKADSGRGGKSPTGNRGKGNSNGADEDSDGGDGKKNNPKSKTKLPQLNRPKQWYACPFHKHDPLYFSINDETRKKYKTCTGKFDDMSRLKEHLYRVHKDPPTCDRCQEQFKNQDQLTAHLRNQESLTCPLEGRRSRGISLTVVTELKKRPRRDMLDDDRWYEIWDLLFPDEKRPSSPYPDSHGPFEVPPEVDTFQDYLGKHAGPHISKKFNAAVDHMRLPITESLKKQLTELFVRVERASRQELWEYYQMGQILTSPSPGQMSEDSDSRSPAVAATITDGNSKLAFEQNYNTPYKQSGGSSRPLNTANAFVYGNGYFNHPPTTTTLQPTTPASSHLPRPRTPAQNSSSPKSADSTYYSNAESGSHSDILHQTEFVDPAVLAFQDSPTPYMPQSRKNMAPPHGANLSRNTSHSPGHSRHPAVSSPWPPGASDAMMGDGLSDQDAPHSPDHTYQAPRGAVWLGLSRRV